MSIVIPCYNEQDRLPATLEAITKYMAARGSDYELILADDGSSDRTPEVIGAAVKGGANVRMVRLPENRGKGRALAEGVKLSSGDRVLLTDADLSTPIEELPKLEARLDAGAGVAIASRALRGSEIVIHQPVYRVLMGKTFNLIVQALLLPGLWDTQCGFKLFRGDLARSVFAELRTDGFGYDPEALFRAKRRGEKIAEVPVVWRHSAPTKVAPFRHSLDMFQDVVRTRFRS
ncbi:MAG TPA: dolichyl-phosphate beta-glucosyltransferase [Candidatus Dormibacteraeota bacterium]|nr:dolichyl-phosphate beta-glucosyltransferase [Candidatus Dormibacteraeota bacterium]